MSRRALLAPTLAFAACATNALPDPHVGEQPDGSVLVTTGQRVRPAGGVLRFFGRPVDLALGQNFAYIKEIDALLVVELASSSIVQRLSFGSDQGASLHGIAISSDHSRLFVTDAKHSLREAGIGRDGRLTWLRSIDLPAPKIGGEPYPCGLALNFENSLAYVCLSRSNTIAVIDLEHGTLVREIPVGVAPYDVVLSGYERELYVSNFGGRAARKGEPSAETSGTAIAVDARGIAASGTVTKIDLTETPPVAISIEAGLHPSDLVLTRDGKRLFVAAANSDAVIAIDTASFSVAETIDVRLDPKLPFGCIVDALALSPDGTRLYAANAGNNAVAVVRLGHGDAHSTVEGFIPTDWFPGAIACDGNELFIACVRGDGSRDAQEGGKWHSGWFRGSVARVAQPDSAMLASWSTTVRQDARVPQALLAAARARGGVPARPVPERTGEPSLFEHVVYVIKENRTYDQVFGDLAQGNSDPALCIYGREITPNHHALAEQFALLDNYYCNGVLSSDGHQWATQGIIVDYQEKQFGGWTRSYDFGTDALTYAASNFLWDSALLAGLSFRNYGELEFPRLDAPKGNWFDVYRDWQSGSKALRFTQSVPIDTLHRYTAPRYPGWELKIPDQLRVDRFLEEFRAAERRGDWPSLVIVYLPQDHTSGTSAHAPTPRAHIADNDLALGRLVEAISNSRFWPKTCIFVNEDDPQNGFDHVDGHRSLCLVASPYTKRGAVVSRFYDQTSVLHTIERILGLAPMNQMDAAATTMEDCFTNKLDARPYVALPNRIPLDERNPAKTAALSESLDLHLPDQIDEDQMNRILWLAARGPNVPYPAEFAGAHGRGLKALGLKLDPRAEDDDDD